MNRLPIAVAVMLLATTAVAEDVRYLDLSRARWSDCPRAVQQAAHREARAATPTRYHVNELLATAEISDFALWQSYPLFIGTLWLPLDDTCGVQTRVVVHDKTAYAAIDFVGCDLDCSVQFTGTWTADRPRRRVRQWSPAKHGRGGLPAEVFAVVLEWVQPAGRK